MVEEPSRPGTSATSQLAGRMLWNLTGIVTSNVARLVALALVGQVGGAATLGNVQTAVSTANLAAMAGPTSVGSAAGRYLPISGPRAGPVARRLLWHGNALGLLFALVCGAVFVPFFGPQVALATAVLAFVLCQWAVARGIAIADGTALRSMILVEAVGALALVVAMAGAVLLGAPWPFYLLALTVLHVPLTLSVLVRHRRDPRATSIGVGYRRYVWWGVVGTVASGGLVHLMNVVTNGLGGAVEAGYLAAGLLLVSPLGMLSSALAQVSLPWFSRLLDDGREGDARDKGRQLSASMQWVVGTVVLVLVPFGPRLARLVFGTDMRLDHATFIVLGAATVAMASRIGAVVLLSARGYEQVRRMAVLSYVGLGAAVLVWGITYAVQGRVSALSAGLGYGLGAALVTVLITAVAHGAGAAGWSVVGLVSWLGAAYGVTYAGAQLGLPAVLAVALASALWIVSNRDGIRFLLGWGKVWVGDR
ncbi:lipopolysaccharide biosynthesis protein [Ornithinimicrobium sp. LYQ121]|uniref:lipopolysaccharide biosynthesis protein n=1 Tax=Ornithinimicrobium sp. LYQ121 TaxID=3378801 RepID=UPI0038545412